VLPTRLKTIRKLRGYSQEDLAEKINTTKSTISNYENGHSSPSADTLIRLADVLNTTTDYLLGRTDHAQVPDADLMATDLTEREKQFLKGSLSLLRKTLQDERDESR